MLLYLRDLYRERKIDVLKKTSSLFYVIDCTVPFVSFQTEDF